jgi:hypothetical protein
MASTFGRDLIGSSGGLSILFKMIAPPYDQRPDFVPSKPKDQYLATNIRHKFTCHRRPPTYRCFERYMPRKSKTFGVLLRMWVMLRTLLIYLLALSIIQVQCASSAPQSAAQTSSPATDLPLSYYCSNLANNVDVTSCLQTAINSTQALGVCLILSMPPTVTDWLISSTIEIGNGSSGTASTKNGVCIRGVTGASVAVLYGGGYGAYFKWNGAAGTSMFAVNGPINGVSLKGIMLNGNNVAGRLIQFNSVRDAELVDVGGAGCTAKCWDFQGLASSSPNPNIVFQIAASRDYVTTSVSGAIALNFDGVLTNNTDTWLSTFANSRFESLGPNGIAIRLGYSDHILFSQVHALARDGCGILFDSTTSGNGGNAFPQGHVFVGGSFLGKSPTDSLCVKSSPGNAIGENYFVGFDTSDGQAVPTNPLLRGTTDTGIGFNFVSFSSAAFLSRGDVPSLSGTCATGAQAGGNTVGSFKATSPCVGTVIITFAEPAPNGWACDAQDETTATNTLRQTSHSRTSCTLAARLAESDIVVFKAIGF